jgi:hypothetical protein
MAARLFRSFLLVRKLCDGAIEIQTIDWLESSLREIGNHSTHKSSEWPQVYILGRDVFL